MNRQQLEKRVIEIANKTLQEKHYVSCVDILLGIGWLQPVRVNDWRKGRLPYLEQAVQANLNKLSYAMKCFRQWANKCGLKPSETKYLARTRGQKRELRFSESGNPAIEKAYRTHYISPVLSQKKQENLKTKLDKPPEHVVFCILKESTCEQCKEMLHKGSFLYTEQDKALCMKCSGFDELVYLPAGNAKLTRRAKQYSKSYAVVVWFSRARKRYERQGLLVEESALKRAEDEVNVDYHNMKEEGNI
ncbi:MAG: hypothetical protein COV52_05340 [Gammaproteobacteria bacterium CG11_big_fil_rev_8_21_14_0_20_46_22]|nr:MAG: hypothetical protein COW05_04675 [Gammaproteobacteria bacterium CG12_big_fil_rev_8_21_14_0_65_46_12]PIR11164.1 MAG: hypothetical protein COV52_05340 [Gammaproteobacteria bacterium CG11_big_fil_rev_8_21_14_0_20_46_22]